MRRARELLNDFLACESGPNVPMADVRELQAAAGLGFMFWRKVGAGIAPLFGWGFVLRRLQEGTMPVRVADDWEGGVAMDDEAACAGCIHHVHWTAPYFFKFQGVSLGAVAGFLHVHTLLALHRPEHVDFFMKRRVMFGADLTVADGPHGSVEMPSSLVPHRTSLKGCRKWHLSNGIIVDASVRVMLLHRDRTTNRYAYGHNASARKILGGEVAPPREAIMLFTDIAELIE